MDNAAAPDPFDPANLRLSPDVLESAPAKKLLTQVPVRKPQKQDFVRVHPGKDYRLEPVGLLELKEERESFLVLPHVHREIVQEVAAVRLHLGVNRQGVLFVWSVRLPGPDGKINPWHESAVEAAELAMRSWIRMSADMSLGGYAVYQATGNLPDPEWPVMTFSEILKIAFKNKVIDTLDHPVLKQLRGEV